MNFMYTNFIPCLPGTTAHACTIIKPNVHALIRFPVPFQPDPGPTCSHQHSCSHHSRMTLSKALMVLVDGIGDVSLPDLGDRTPLEVSHHPILDACAAAGLNGLMDSVEPGEACGSDTAHMSLFGYNPRVHYRGRGAFESMGAGIPMAPGDIAFKCNFATLETSTGIVVRRRADRNFEHLGPTLCQALDDLQLPNHPGYRVRVMYATEHRCGVAVSGPGLSDAVSGTDPLKDQLPLLRSAAEDGTPQAAFTAGLVNELSDTIHSVLASHPINAQRAQEGLPVANVVLLRGCGSRINVPDFYQQHGMRAVLVAPTKIIAGLGMSFGMDQVEAPGATGYYDSDYSSKAATICKALIQGVPGTGSPSSAQQEAHVGSTDEGGKQYEFGFVHVKGVDDAGHDRRPQLKVQLQEAVDRMMGQIVKRLWEAERASGGAVQFTLVITGDHSTPVMFGDHSFEPVPFCIAHVKHVVDALGEDYVSRISLGPITMPDASKDPPTFQQLCTQAGQVDARRRAAWAGRLWYPFMPAEVFGPWPDPWPQEVRGDPVRSFDELSAARGALGRFPGSQVMTLIKHFTGRPVDASTPQALAAA